MMSSISEPSTKPTSRSLLPVAPILDQIPLQGERREKYTYPKGATAVLTEKVRDIKVSQAQVGGGQVSFEECDLEYILN